MRRFPPSVRLCAVVIAVVALVVVKSPLVLCALGLPALLASLREPAARRALRLRLQLIAPVAGAAVGLRFLGHAPSDALWTALLRVLGAAAWSTRLSVELSPRELDSALRALRVPSALLDLIGQTRRFSRQLLHTSSDAWSAALLRGGLLSARASARTAGVIAGVIVVRAFDRAENVAIAAALRGAAFADSAPAAVGAIAVEELG